MSKLIKFPSERIRFDATLERKFVEARNLPPEITDCLKDAYKRIKAQQVRVLPSFELHASSNEYNNEQIKAIREAANKMMGGYREYVLSMLESIMSLEAELCILKFQLAKLRDSR